MSERTDRARETLRGRERKFEGGYSEGISAKLWCSQSFHVVLSHQETLSFPVYSEMNMILSGTVALVAWMLGSTDNWLCQLCGLPIVSHTCASHIILTGGPGLPTTPCGPGGPGYPGGPLQGGSGHGWRWGGGSAFIEYTLDKCFILHNACTVWRDMAYGHLQCSNYKSDQHFTSGSINSTCEN